ncbi:putative ribonuclease H protein [Ananas comosus]|uniref:Putative ribonuclease H protein n=1 Tax=Ananas comosus TaxID=4615 RepID=A0A199USX2_ANACO|nr:putative ribonuclease H protein [Ananas comosus]
MKINREKSELYYLGQKAGKGVRLANILECRTGAFPTNYLGLPLSPRPPSKEAWRGIIQKFHHKIGGWQAKLLSRGGRLILVNAVLTNIPLFSLAVFKAPRWGVLGLNTIFKWGTAYKLGNGHSIDFWSDRWSGEKTLNLTFPEAYQAAVCKNLKVSECFTRGAWNWTRILGTDVGQVQGHVPNLTELVQRISAFIIDQRPDTIQWRWNTDGQFSVKSAYSALTDGGVRDACVSKIWELKIPLKFKVFGWLVLKKRTLTRDILVKRGISNDPTCVLCGTHEETVDHLFCRCVFSKFIIVTGVDDIQAQDLGDELIRSNARHTIKTAV